MTSNSLVIPPRMISLLVTNKCTAACKYCCFGCNPKNKERLTLEEMKSYIDQSGDAYPSVMGLVFTGGECFTIGKDLDKIIKYGADKGLSVRVVTNGYWAKSLKKAYIRLKTLKELGLKELNLSTGDAHQQFVPFDNIVYAIAAALKLDLTAVVNIETSPIFKFTSDTFRKDFRLQKYANNSKLIILNGVWMPFTESTELEVKDIRKNIKESFGANKKCKSLFNTISVMPNNQVNACCGLTSQYIPFLKLGNAKTHSIKELYEHQFNDFVKIWLFTEGPKKY